MSLRDTRDIGTAKIVMVGGGGGGGASSLADLTDTSISSPSNGQVLEYDGISGKWENKIPTGYTAGSGIDITNNAIVNTRKGALTGVIDSISSGYAHTQMTGARDTFTAGALIVVQSEASGSATNLRIQYGSQASDSQDFRFYDTAGQTTTLTIASGETINAMIDPTGYRAIVLSQYKAVAVDANTGTPTAELKKLKVGSTVYNTDAIKHYSATAISNGSISVSVPNAGHLNGEIIAVNTGSLTGTTSNAWTLALSDGMTIETLTVLKADGTAFTDAITANELLFIKCNTSNDTAVLLGIAGASGGSGMPENPLATSHGGTGNADGFIRTGQKSGTTIGTNATAEGYNTTASAYTAHAEGASTTASNDSAHSEGEHTLASSTASHAEGSHSTASGIGAHSEGSAYVDFDSGNYVGNTASGEGAHAEGMGTTASGKASHTEGYGTSASGNYSHASGGSTTAGYAYQTVVGKINDNKSSTLFEVGNGTGSSARSNAFEVYNDGKISCDNGASKFQFTQSSGVDGYYDASGTFHAFGSGGSGNTVSKTRYQISSSSWSSSANSDGFYTLTVSLNPAIGSSPDVYVAGSADGTQPTDAQKEQFAYVKRCKVNGSTLTLYASSKPSSTFYIWVEGANGIGSGDIVGNVIQPNGAVSGGMSLYDKPVTTVELNISEFTQATGFYYGLESPSVDAFDCNTIALQLYMTDSSQSHMPMLMDSQICDLKYLRDTLTYWNIRNSAPFNINSVGSWYYYIQKSYGSNTYTFLFRLDNTAYTNYTNNKIILRIYKLD